MKWKEFIIMQLIITILCSLGMWATAGTNLSWTFIIGAILGTMANASWNSIKEVDENLNHTDKDIRE